MHATGAGGQRLCMATTEEIAFGSLGSGRQPRRPTRALDGQAAKATTDSWRPKACGFIVGRPWREERAREWHANLDGRVRAGGRPLAGGRGNAVMSR